MSWEMRANLEVFGLIIGVFVAIFLPLGGLFIGVDYYQCQGFGKATGHEVQYVGLECYAKLDGKFVPSKFVFGKSIELRAR